MNALQGYQRVSKDLHQVCFRRACRRPDAPIRPNVRVAHYFTVQGERISGCFARKGRMIGGADRPSSLPVELVERHAVRDGVDRLDSKPVLACSHFRKLFFTRNRAGKTQDRLAQRHSVAIRQSSRSRIGSSRGASSGHDLAHRRAPLPTSRFRHLARGTTLRRNNRRCSAHLPNRERSRSRRPRSGRVLSRRGPGLPRLSRASEQFRRACVAARSLARRRLTRPRRRSQPRSCSAASSASAALRRWLTAFFSFSVSVAKLRPKGG